MSRSIFPTILAALFVLGIGGTASAQDFVLRENDPKVVELSAQNKDKTADVFEDRNNDGVYDTATIDEKTIVGEVNVKDAQGFQYKDGWYICFYPTTWTGLPKPGESQLLGFIHYFDANGGIYLAIVEKQAPDDQTTHGLGVFFYDSAGNRIGSPVTLFVDKGQLATDPVFGKWGQETLGSSVASNPSNSNFFLLARNIGFTDRILLCMCQPYGEMPQQVPDILLETRSLGPASLATFIKLLECFGGASFALDVVVRDSDSTVVQMSSQTQDKSSAFQDKDGDAVYDTVILDGKPISGKVLPKNAQGFQYEDGRYVCLYPTDWTGLPKPGTRQFLGFMHYFDTKNLSTYLAIVAEQAVGDDTTNGLAIFFYDSSGLRVGAPTTMRMEKAQLRAVPMYQQWVKTGADFGIGSNPLDSQFFLFAKSLGLTDVIMVVMMQLYQQSARFRSRWRKSHCVLPTILIESLYQLLRNFERI